MKKQNDFEFDLSEWFEQFKYNKSKMCEDVGLEVPII